MASRGSTDRRPRVALYSHDAQGLGHTRRNLAVAGALQALDPAPDVLVLTGAPEAAVLRRPPRTDIVGLPAMAKDTSGIYTARHLSLVAEDLSAIRASVLTGALTSFNPDLLIVDKHPRGFRGELLPALHELSSGHTRVVLGLRDVLDDPDRSRVEWDAVGGSEALTAFYDQVWLYGDPAIYDATLALGLPAELTDRVVPTGYLAHGRLRPHGAQRTPTHPMHPPYVLCLLGGGSDGDELARTFARSELPVGHHGVLVTGPQMPDAARQEVHDLVDRRDDMHVHEFLDDIETWLACAAAVVSMGGYNTVCEVLAADRPLLIVPRVRPRTEQLVRATALARTDAVDVVHPDVLTPLHLHTWATHAVTSARRPRQGLDLEGLTRLPDLAAVLLESTSVLEADHVA
ncbi:MAG TPA: glycosyltransferase [Jiangellaceae bacterium]|nr:glycosyltransferase [Jiangellaceae bacterium]